MPPHSSANQVPGNDEDECDDYFGLAGDYIWRSPDGGEEALLRLQPSGRCWHARHARWALDAVAPQGAPEGAMTGTPAEIWELLESLGSWRAHPIYEGRYLREVALRFTCEGSRSASNCRHPFVLPTQLQYRQDPGARAMLAEGAGSRVDMRYLVRWNAVTGHRSLALSAKSEEQEKRFTAEAWALGFARSYEWRQSGSAVGPTVAPSYPRALAAEHHSQGWKGFCCVRQPTFGGSAAGLAQDKLPQTKAPSQGVGEVSPVVSDAPAKAAPAPSGGQPELEMALEDLLPFGSLDGSCYAVA